MISKSLWHYVLVSSTILAVFVLSVPATKANEVLSTEQQEVELDLEIIDNQLSDDNTLDQVNSVRELKDVDPFWEEAVEKMVDQYGCMVGYPDRTFQGEREITRYEFAAAMSLCMEYIENRFNGRNEANSDHQESEITELTDKINELREAL